METLPPSASTDGESASARLGNSSPSDRSCFPIARRRARKNGGMKTLPDAVSPSPSRSARRVKLTVLYMSNEGRAVAVAIDEPLTRLAPAEDIARVVLAELAERHERLNNDDDETTLPLPGLGEVHLALDRRHGFPVMAVLTDRSALAAWRCGVRVVTRVRAVDAAWLWSAPARKGGRR